MIRSSGTPIRGESWIEVGSGGAGVRVVEVEVGSMESHPGCATKECYKYVTPSKNYIESNSTSSTVASKTKNCFNGVR
jgi:hypothetical protein